LFTKNFPTPSRFVDPRAARAQRCTVEIAKSHDRDKVTHCTTSKPATADTPETVLFFSLDSTIVPFEIRHHYHHGRHRASK
jgi:hypothetical protein